MGHKMLRMRIRENEMLILLPGRGLQSNKIKCKALDFIITIFFIFLKQFGNEFE